jgi:hypothetical protein
MSGGFCGRDCRALLFPGPSRPRRAGGGNSRAERGHAQDARASDLGTGMCRERTPEPAREVREGAFFFGYFLLGKQKKVTGGHEWPTNHTRT